MVDFDESDKMIKISGNWINPNTYYDFVPYSRKNFFRIFFSIS